MVQCTEFCSKIDTKFINNKNRHLAESFGLTKERRVVPARHDRTHKDFDKRFGWRPNHIRAKNFSGQLILENLHKISLTFIKKGPVIQPNICI